MANGHQEDDAFWRKLKSLSGVQQRNWRSLTGTRTEDGLDCSVTI